MLIYLSSSTGQASYCGQQPSLLVTTAITALFTNTRFKDYETWPEGNGEDDHTINVKHEYVGVFKGEGREKLVMLLRSEAHSLM